MLTQERLKELFHYDPETGLFIRLVKTSKKVKIGDVAGTPCNGYIQIGIDKKVYLAHRLAFLYMTGKWPEVEVDHEDTIRHHNWWSNLRECNYSENAQNQKKSHKDSKTGYLGIYPNPKDKKTFLAQIKINEKRKFLGKFNTKEEAYQCYLKAKRDLHLFNTL